MKNLHCYFDGGFKKTKGYFSIAVYEIDSDNLKHQVHKETKVNSVPINSGNQAEYQGLIFTLEHLLEKEYTDYNIIIYSDSKLVCGQLTGKFNVYSDNIKFLYERAFTLLEEVSDNENTIKLEWVPRQVMLDLFGH